MIISFAKTFSTTPPIDSRAKEIAYVKGKNGLIIWKKRQTINSQIDSMKNILNRVELCSRLIDIDPVRCRLELSSVMKILTDLIEEKDESDF